MPEPPKKNSSVPLALIDTPDDLDENEKRAMEAIIACVCGADDTQMGQIFRICCCNSRRRPGQLVPRFIRQLKGLEGVDQAIFTRLRQKLQKDVAKCAADYGLAVIPIFEEDTYRIIFQSSAVLATEQKSTLGFPVSPERFVTLETLLKLERLEDNGGHLLPGAELIVQGATPLLSRPEVAAIVLDNLSHDIRYQFVFPQEPTAQIALALSTLLAAGNKKGLKIQETIGKIGGCLEIYLSTNIWPFVVSVHNARHDQKATSYLRIPDSDCLLKLHEGEQAHKIAANIRTSVIGYGHDVDEQSWFRSETDAKFRDLIMDELSEALHPRLTPTERDLLKQHLFGTKQPVALGAKKT